MTANPVVLRVTPYTDPMVRLLEAGVQQEYVARYGGPDRTPVDAAQFDPPAGVFLVGWVGADAVACGGFRANGPDAEIQRMYVQHHARGMGAGRQLVEQLLADARAIGYRAVRLESLKVLAAAHALYRSVGFVEITSYAENSMKNYQAAETLDTYRSSAVFMELRL